MSKAVKKVGRAIGKVVKGAVKILVPAASKTGRKLLKVAAVAAAIYFGVPAVMGAFGAGGAAAAGGLSGLSGAAANISAAWQSLGTAGTALMSGQFASAGNALASGFSGTAATGGSALASAAPAALAQPAAGAFTGATSTGLPTVAADAANVMAAGGGAAGAGDAGGAAGGAGGYAAIADAMKTGAYVSAGTQLAGGLIGGAGQQKAMEEQRNFELQQQQAARDRYNQNVGTNWWSGSDTDTSATTSLPPPVFAQPAASGLVAGAMTPQQRYDEMMRRQMQTYNPYALPTRI